MNKKVIVISGPSGVGKTTLCAKLAAAEPRIKPCLTATTRAPRPGEADGRDYYFVSRETFQDWLAKGEIIESTELFGNYYGTPRKSLEAIFRQDAYPLLRIDVAGARAIKRLDYPAIFIFILPPDEATLARRLAGRRTEAQKDVQERLTRAREELKYQEEYQFRVVNDNLDRAVREIRDILNKHLFKEE